jgi:hypothetical protein
MSFQGDQQDDVSPRKAHNNPFERKLFRRKPDLTRENDDNPEATQAYEQPSWIQKPREKYGLFILCEPLATEALCVE